jgi:hypothetical protein
MLYRLPNLIVTALALVLVGCSQAPQTLLEPQAFSDVEALATRSYGPVTNPVIPTGAVIIYPSTANIQSKLNGTGTAFLFKAGVYYNLNLNIPAGKTLVGEKGAILDGRTAAGASTFNNLTAVTLQAGAVLRNIEVRNYTGTKSTSTPAVRANGNNGLIENIYSHHNGYTNLVIGGGSSCDYKKA